MGKRRLIALGLIAAVLLGFGYLRFAPPAGAVRVPADAKVGDLTLSPCVYTTESGDYAADCGTLIVAENPSNPNSLRIALPVVRIKARSGGAAEPIFFFAGGPGLSNMVFPQASRFATDRDVVLVGYPFNSTAPKFPRR